MSYYYKEDKGLSIKPSARRSIHSHSCCPFDKEYIMGRHGLLKKRFNIENPRPPLNQDDEEMDEVDNIMSKFAHPIQIPTRNKIKYQRRNSLDLNKQDFTSDRNVLSKSLPTSLETNPSCSDDSYSDEDSAQKMDFTNQSSHTRSNLSEYSMENDILEKSSFIQWLVIPVVLAVLCITYVAGIFGDFQNKVENSNTLTVKNKYDTVKFYNDLSSIGEKYKVNDDTILMLQTGISVISEKHDTGSFMFVYNSEASNFDPGAFYDFVNDVVSVAARYLRNESSTVRHIVVDSSRLVVRDSDELIEKYKADVTKSGVLLLMRIDTLPSSLAMALHYYCDEYNPLIKKSAIFSTLDLANCYDQQTTHSHIEKCLSKKWHSIPADNIGPLLTRVVSVVVDVTSVF